MDQLLCAYLSHIHYWYEVGMLNIHICMVITYSRSKDQPGKVTSRAGDQLNGGKQYFPVPVRAQEFSS